jgi:hypothetical protein
MTAHAFGEVTLPDLRSIDVTKGFTHWRTAGAANDNETTVNTSESQRIMVIR